MRGNEKEYVAKQLFKDLLASPRIATKISLACTDEW
jgi:hypothetical protein